MVVFTCQHCGEPIKKAAVEKHYSTRCYFKSPYLTCVDCLKDFSIEDYGNHNQCVTEEQRYSAVGTVTKEQKGRKKQQQYIEMIQNLLSSQDMTQVQRKLLEVCQKFDNVPRKFNKFQNFMMNVARGFKYTADDLNFVFQRLEDNWTKQRESSTAQHLKTEAKNVNEKVENSVIKNEKMLNDSNEELITDKSNTEPSKSKKKKNNKSLSLDHEQDNLALENINEEIANDINNTQSSKVKKKKHKDKNLSLDYEKVIVTKDDDLKDSKDENTLDSKQDNLAVNGGNINEEITNDRNNSQSHKVKNKKHKDKNLSLADEKVMDTEEGDLRDANDEKTIDSKEGNIEDLKENLSSMSKKKLKKQKKYEKYLAELESEKKVIECESTENGEIVISDKKRKNKSKKNKAKCLESETSILYEDRNSLNVNEVSNETESKKNKRKLEESVCETPEKRLKEVSDEVQPAVFNWGDVIVKVLQSRPDKELSLKKLGKKVANEYKVVKPDHRTYEELLVKFNKKVNKIKGVRVLRDRAKLIE